MAWEMRKSRMWVSSRGVTRATMSISHQLAVSPLPSVHILTRRGKMRGNHHQKVRGSGRGRCQVMSLSRLVKTWCTLTGGESLEKVCLMSWYRKNIWMRWEWHLSLKLYVHEYHFSVWNTQEDICSLLFTFCTWLPPLPSGSLPNMWMSFICCEFFQTVDNFIGEIHQCHCVNPNSLCESRFWFFFTALLVFLYSELDIIYKCGFRIYVNVLECFHWLSFQPVTKRGSLSLLTFSIA